MKKIIILLFLITAPLYAQKEYKLGGFNNSIHTFRLSAPQLDGWSAGHAFGGYVMSATFRMAGVEPATRAWLVFGASVIHEIYKDGFGNKLFDFALGKRDPRGADFVADVFFTILGSWIEILINKALN